MQSNVQLFCEISIEQMLTKNRANSSNKYNWTNIICSSTFNLPVSETTTFLMEPFSVACLIFLLSAAQYTKPCTSSTSIPRICTAKTMPHSLSLQRTFLLYVLKSQLKRFRFRATNICVCTSKCCMLLLLCREYYM